MFSSIFLYFGMRAASHLALDLQQRLLPPVVCTCAMADSKLCSCCQFESSSGSFRGAVWVCKGCLALNSMLLYKLGSGAASVSSTMEDKVAFFRRAKPQAEGQRLKWETVRAVVQDHIIRRHMREHRQSTEGKYLPMKMHLQAGWTQEQVESKNDWMEDPELGKVWRVPVVSKTSCEIYQEVEEELTRRETEVSKKRQSKKRAKTEEDGKEPEDFDLPEEPESEKASKKLKTEEKEAAAVAKAILKANKAKHVLAAKAVGPLTGLVTSLTNFQKSAGKYWEDLDGSQRQGLTEALAQATAYKSAATAVVHQQDLAAAKNADSSEPPQPLPELDFEAEQLQTS